MTLSKLKSRIGRLVLVVLAGSARAADSTEDVPREARPCEEGVPVDGAWNAWLPESGQIAATSPMLLPPRWQQGDEPNTWRSGRSRLSFGIHGVADYPIPDRLVETCVIEAPRGQAHVSRYRRDADGIVAVALVGDDNRWAPVVLEGPEEQDLAELTTILRTMLGPYRAQGDTTPKGRDGAPTAHGLVVRLKEYRSRDIEQDGELGSRLAAELVNEGTEELRLVRPGLGSQQGLRTPFVSLHVGRRGHPVPFSTMLREVADDVTEEDLVTLMPGEACFLDYLATHVEVDVAGKLLVAWRYENLPALPTAAQWPDEAMEERLSTTSRCSAASAPLSIHVEWKAPRRAAHRRLGR